MFTLRHILLRDTKILLCMKAIRMFSCGFLAVIFVLYLEQLELNGVEIGLVFSSILVGDAVITILLTGQADKVGRKKTLLISSLLSLGTCIIFTCWSNFWILCFVGAIGVISPSGNEVGSFMSIELSGLAQISQDNERIKLMRLYNFLGCVASARGAVFCGFLVVYLNIGGGLSLVSAYRTIMIIYGALQILLFMISNMLGEEIEVPFEVATTKTVNPFTLFVGLHQSKSIVINLSLMFMMDAFANALVMQSIISFWFDKVYHTHIETLGFIVFSCNLTAGITSLFAVRVADHLGVLTTMVVASIPGNLLLLFVPLMPYQSLAMILLCIRYSMVQMDIPARNAYIQGFIHADERSAANGVTNVMRSLGVAIGPLVSLYCTVNPSYINYPFYIAGAIKLFYDLVLIVSLRTNVFSLESSARKVTTIVHIINGAQAFRTDTETTPLTDNKIMLQV